MILAAIDPKYQRFSQRLAPLAGRILWMGLLIGACVAISYLFMQSQGWKVVLVAAPFYIAYSVFTLRKTLLSIAVNEESGTYEIKIININSVETFILKKEEVEIRVVGTPNRHGVSYKLQIMHRRKEFYVQEESVFWTADDLKVLKDYLEQQNFKT